MTAALAAAAREVVELATRKGQLFATDEETGSDRLVGFFVPAEPLLRLARASQLDAVVDRDTVVELPPGSDLG